MPLHTRAWRTYLERHGLPAHDLVERMHSKRNDQIVADYWGTAITDDENFQHGAAKESLWRELMGPDLDRHLVPGVREFLKSLERRPMAIGTNAEPENAEFVLEGTGLRRFFQVVVDGHQVEHPKPAPDVYLRAAELLGVAPADCVVFEDSQTGIRAARAAGMRCVGVDSSRTGLTDVDLCVPDFQAADLKGWINRMFR